MTSGGLPLLVAAAPIVVVLMLLVVRVPSLWAAAAGLGVAVLGAVAVFPVDAATARESAQRLGPTVVTVALILLGGVALAEATGRTGARGRIETWLAGVESGTDRTLTLLLLVFGLTPFMESVTGFGLGVVITAPLLVGMGLPPVKAVIAGLLGLVLVPWGSLAPGTLVAAELGGQDFTALGVWSAILTLPVLLVNMTAVIALLIGRPTVGQVGLAFLVVVVEWGALVAANLLVGPPPAGVVAATAVMLVLLALARLRHGRLPAVTGDLGRALVPYGVLVAGILTATGLLTVTGAGGGAGWATSPALWLLVAALTALSPLRHHRADLGAAVRASLWRWVPIATVAVAFMVLGIVMATTGMAAHLAVTAARAGPGFVAAIPLIGALGGYLTGSNTGAAAMFSTATAVAATGVGASPLIALAGQNVAGSVSIIVSPPRVALAVGVALPAGERLPAAATRTLGGCVLAGALLLGGIVLVLA